MLELLYKKYLKFVKLKIPKDLYNIIINQNNKYDFILTQARNNYDEFDPIIQTITKPRPNTNSYNIIFGTK
jgi:hypothetical protein